MNAPQVLTLAVLALIAACAAPSIRSLEVSPRVTEPSANAVFADTRSNAAPDHSSAPGAFVIDHPVGAAFIGDLVVTANEAGHLMAFDHSTGVRVWSKTLEDRVTSVGRLGDGLLVATAKHVVAYDAAGKVIRQIAPTERGGVIAPYLLGPTDAGGQWVRTHEFPSRMARLDADGTFLPVEAFTDPPMSFRAVLDLGRRMVVLAQQGDLATVKSLKIDTVEAGTLFTTPAGGATLRYCSWVDRGPDGSVLLGGVDGVYHTTLTERGMTVAQRAGFVYTADGVTSPDGSILYYVSASFTSLRAVSSVDIDGPAVWEHALDRYPGISLAISDDGRTLAATHATGLYLYNTETGAAF